MTDQTVYVCAMVTALHQGVSNLLVLASFVALVVFTITGTRAIRAHKKIQETDGLGDSLDKRKSNKVKLNTGLLLGLFSILIVVGMLLPLMRAQNVGSLFPSTPSFSWGWAFWTDLTRAPQLFAEQSGPRSELLFVLCGFSALAASAAMIILRTSGLTLARVLQWSAYGMVASVAWMFDLLNSAITASSSIPGNGRVKVTSFLGAGFYLMALSAVAFAITATFFSVKVHNHEF